MNNAELITALRVEPFEVGSFGLARIMNQAADIIEAQQVDLRKANEIIEEGIRASRKSRAALETAQKLIAELEAKLPKEGEWIDAYIGGNLHKRCPRCGTYIEATFFANDYDVSFCPVCGSRMRKGERE